MNGQTRKRLPGKHLVLRNQPSRFRILVRRWNGKIFSGQNPLCPHDQTQRVEKQKRVNNYSFVRFSFQPGSPEMKHYKLPIDKPIGIMESEWIFHYKPLDKNEELWDDYPDEYYETILLFCFLNKKKAFWMVKLESICPEAIWHYDGKIGYVFRLLFPFVWELGVFKEDYFAFSKNRKRYKQEFWEKPDASRFWKSTNLWAGKKYSNKIKPCCNMS